MDLRILLLDLLSAVICYLFLSFHGILVSFFQLDYFLAINFAELRLRMVRTIVSFSNFVHHISIEGRLLFIALLEVIDLVRQQDDFLLE